MGIASTLLLRLVGTLGGGRKVGSRRRRQGTHHDERFQVAALECRLLLDGLSGPIDTTITVINTSAPLLLSATPYTTITIIDTIAPVVMGAPPYTNNFNKTIGVDVQDATKGWQDHHRYQVAAKELFDQTGTVGMDLPENIKRLPTYVHEEISDVQKKFWRLQMEELKANDPAVFDGFTRQPSCEDIIEKSPDKMKLRIAYDDMVKDIDTKYGKYWLNSGDTLIDVRRVANNVGATGIDDILSDATKAAFGKYKQARIDSIAGKFLKYTPKLLTVIPAAFLLNHMASRADAWHESGGWTPEIAAVYQETWGVFELKILQPGNVATQESLDVVDAWEDLLNAEGLDNYTYFLRTTMMARILGGGN